MANQIMDHQGNAKSKGMNFIDSKYQTFIELTGLLMWEVSPFGEVVKEIPAFQKFSGLPFEKVKRFGWTLAIHPDDLANVAQIWKSDHYDLERREIEFRVRRKDGIFRDFYSSVAPVRDQQYKTLGWLITCIDITDRKKAETALRESEIKYRTLVENIPMKIFYKNRDLTYVMSNENYAHDLGIKAAEIEGKNDYDFYPPDLAEKYRTDDLRILSTRITEELDERYLDSGEEKIVHTMKTPVIYDSELLGILGVFWDITEQKHNQEKLIQTLDDLEKSNTELERFAYVASHDLQEPLRMVTSYLQLLERRYKDKLDGDALDFINYAVDGSIRMKSLINDLLAFSRVSTRGKEFAATDCEALLARVLRNLEVAIQESQAVITHDPLPVVMADEIQLEQLFQNLIGNAIKFHSDKPLEIHLTVEEKDMEFIFSVHDNGIGIGKEYFDRIFIIFQRLHNQQEYPGTGIGLAISKRIVERHGGKIWVESQPGEGSIFFFSLPKKEKQNGQQSI